MRKFEKVSYIEDEIILPTRATENSAGYDFYANEDALIPVRRFHVFKTGVKAYMPKNEYLAIYIRSSMAFKRNLQLVNQVGIVDSDYVDNPDNEGLICIGLYNIGDKPVYINKGERIAQGIFCKYYTVDGDKSTSKERKGGIGSSGR